MKRILFLLPALLFAFGLSGCPKEKAPESSGDAAAEESATEAPAAEEAAAEESAPVNEAAADSCEGCAKGASGEAVWCESCGHGYVDGKKVSCKGCFDAKAGGGDCEGCASKTDESGDAAEAGEAEEAGDAAEGGDASDG